MKGTWKLKLRMLLTSVIMFTIVYFLIFLVGRYLGISSWRLYAGVSLVIVFLQYWFGPSIVKRSMNVRPLSEAEAPHIHQMVQELADAAGVPKPEIGLSEINIPNAFAYGRTSRSGHIAITRPILGLLDRDELKAVLGHEMGHIINGHCAKQGVLGTAIALIVNKMSKNEIVDFMHKEQAYIKTLPKDIISFKYAESLQI